MKKPSTLRLAALAALAACGASLSSCQSDGYATSLTLTGSETQRDLALDVRRTLEAQETCQSEFGGAFELLTRLQNAGEDEVGGLYLDLQSRVDECAERVRSSGAHIGHLRESGAALFTDWSAELDEFVSPRMRARSEGRLEETRRSLDDLLIELERTQVQMEEILMLQRDYVLFFNHNLGAHSIESLRDENEQFQARMREFAEELEHVHRSADAFIVEMRGAPSGPADAS